jgi:hypothetical protein
VDSMDAPDTRIVDLAERALRTFGGDLGREVAASLLTMWHHYPKLTSTEVDMVLARFAPRPAPPARHEPGRWIDTGSGPGWARGGAR